MKRVRSAPPLEVKLPEGPVPLIKPEDPDHMQVREIWTAHVQTFDLRKPEDVTALEAVWQAVTNGHATISQERVDFNPTTGSYVAYARWATYTLEAPAVPGLGTELG